MCRSTLLTLFGLVLLGAIFYGSSSAYAADSCQPVYDSLMKVITTPSHGYTTHTAPFLRGGKPQSSETIYLGGKMYFNVDGKWSKGDVSPEDMEQQKQARAHSNATCQLMRTESVNGEVSAVYSLHSESQGHKEDEQIWISKNKGLLLRFEQDVDLGAAVGKEHRSARLEYGNIHPPM